MKITVVLISLTVLATVEAVVAIYFGSIPAAFAGIAFAALLGGTAIERIFRKTVKASPEAAPKSPVVPQSSPRRRRIALPTDGSQESELVNAFLNLGREALLLRPQIAENLSPEQRKEAIESIEDAMGIVPGGDVRLETPMDAGDIEDGRRVYVDAFLLDRYPVTNAEFFKFVDAGGYEDMHLWDEDVWPSLMNLVDKTGQPGPRFWEHGSFPPHLSNHPVVGVSWYEAAAYARWVGKRLPTDPEWVKAAAWPTMSGGTLHQKKYPWGDTMNPEYACVWGNGHTTTVPVESFEAGMSAGGIYHLVGNVWEWTASRFVSAKSLRELHPDASGLKSLRGGAFDTYFDRQASCHFSSGDEASARKHNIGFRCAVGLCDLVPLHDIRRDYDTEELDADDELEHELVAKAPASDASQVSEKVTL